MTMLKSQLSTQLDKNYSGLFPFVEQETENVVCYTLEELKLLEDRTDWVKARRQLSDDEINALISEEDEGPNFKDQDDWSKAVFVPAKNKKPISIRIDEDVLLFFKLQGKGYQTAINQILREKMNEMMGKK